MAATIVLFSFVSMVSGLIDYSCIHYNNWRVNLNNHINTYFSTSTEITSSSPYNSNTKWIVTYTRIPYYDRVFIASDITTLNSRPRASYDFTTGAVSLQNMTLL